MAASLRRTTNRKEQPRGCTGVRMNAGAATALLVVLMFVSTFAAACSGQATAVADGSVSPAVSGAPGDGSSSAVSADAGAKATAGADWAHTLQVVSNLRAAPPAEPVVVLLGGSAARESTIDDDSWRAQIAAKGGPATAAFNLGSSNRTLAQNVALVKALPEVPTIVYIGVNLGSFTSAQKTARISLPEPDATLPPYRQHRYSRSHILTTANKRMLVEAWRADRYPVFKRNFATSAGVLEKLIKVCQARGMKPVLFELPRNTAVIGGKLDAPTTRYRDTCKALGKKYDVPYVSLVAAAELPNSSFYDLWHLVEPGREVWQSLLSAKTAALLKHYGYDDGGS